MEEVTRGKRANAIRTWMSIDANGEDAGRETRDVDASMSRCVSKHIQTCPVLRKCR